MSNIGDNEVLEAEFEVGYTYTRSPGVIIGKFLAALKQQQIYGIRGSDGRVLFPPTEYDPISSESLDDFVPLESTGEVVSWTWIAEPRAHHGIDHPFAFALIKLDGADVPFLHRLFCSSESQIAAGLKVKVDWSAERVGMITDIRGFVPQESC